MEEIKKVIEAQNEMLISLAKRVETLEGKKPREEKARPQEATKEELDAVDNLL